MQLHVSMVSQIPIYEQIKIQLKEQIISGKLAPATQLPSIRLLAKELNIGVITSKRVYDDLIQEGFLFSQPGRGVFVATVDPKTIQKMYCDQINEHVLEIVQLAKTAGISKTQLIQHIEDSYKET